ncbi:MAG: PadR family transcriptional regulator [Leucobacter sp.]
MLDDIASQLRRGVVEYCVLGALAEQPMYGWQLASTLTDRKLIASIGTLYPLLSRLRKQGFIVSFEQQATFEDAPNGGPNRKYYRLTPPGEAHLERFRKQWGPFTETVTGLISRGKQ